MTDRIYIAKNTGTGAAPYAIVHRDAMGATAYVPKSKLDKVKADLAAAQVQIEALRGLVEIAGRARLVISTAFLKISKTVNYAPSVIVEVCDMLEPHSALPAKAGE